MKILGIEIENLGALQGTHAVDFDGDLGEASLFAIVGPTGAGKSTLTDAIALALFGVTSRLTRKTGDDGRDPIQLMSRGTGFMRASARFRTVGQAGATEYRATYQRQRARKKADGAPQDALRILERRQAGAWVTVVSSAKAKDSKSAFDEALGSMTVEDFYRSVILPQGEFAAFLRMEASTRAATLDRLTRSFDFARVGRMAKALAGQSRERVTELERRGGDVVVLDAEALRGLEERVVALEGLRRDAKRETLRAAERIAAVDVFAKTLADVEEAERLQRTHEARLQEHVGDGQRLAAHARAARVMVAYEAVRRDEADAARLLADRGAAVARGAALLERRALAVSALDAATTALQEAEAAGQREAEAISALDVLDAHAESARRVAKDSTTRLSDAKKSHDDRVHAHRALQENHASAVAARDAHASTHEASVQALAASLGGHADGASALADLDRRATAIQERAAFLASLCEAIARRSKAESSRAAVGMEARRSLEAERERSLESAREVVSVRERTIAVLREQHERESRVAALGAYRSELVSGDACPLCGATEHPACDDAALAAVFADAARTLAELEAQRDAAEALLRKARDEERESVSRHADAKARRETGETELARLQAEIIVETTRIADLASRCEADANVTSESARALETQNAESRGALQSERKALEAKLQLLKASTEALAGAEAEFVRADAAIGPSAQQLMQLASALTKAESEAEVATRASHAFDAELRAAVGDISLPERRLRLRTGLATARQARVDCEAEASRAATEEASAQSSAETLRKEHEGVLERLDRQSRPILRKRLDDEDFPDVDAAGHVLLSDADAARLGTEQRERMDAALHARGGHEAARLAHVASVVRLEAIPWDTQVDPASVRDELDAKVREFDEEAGRIASQLERHREAAKRLASITDELVAARRELAIRDRLHALIGQRDGEKFRTFAQTLNLAGLLVLANDELGRLSRRYTLVPIPNEVDFEVSDAFYADERRPLSTLSGGETFLVSLALALGLARYSASRRSIETLLLDEGFGTLDPETLETAMQALEALRARGTQVGVITHVEALKERVPARILVEALGNGRSQLRIDSGRALGSPSKGNPGSRPPPPGSDSESA